MVRTTLLFILLSYAVYSQDPIPLEISKRGHIMIKAKINGVEGNFIFDTGAGFHVVSKKFFSKITHAVRDSSFHTGFRHTGERMSGMNYLLNSIEVGDLHQVDPWIAIYAGFDEMGFDGLISCKLIEHQAVTFDLKNNQLIVESNKSKIKSNAKTIPLLLHEDRDKLLDIFIAIQVDRKHTAIVEFDTGSGYSPFLLHSRFMKYAGVDTTTLEIRNLPTGFGTIEKSYFDKTKKVHTYIPNVTEGGYPNIVFKPGLIYDGLVSHLILEGKRWTIDIPNRKMYVFE